MSVATFYMIQYLNIMDQNEATNLYFLIDYIILSRLINAITILNMNFFASMQTSVNTSMIMLVHALLTCIANN